MDPKPIIDIITALLTAFGRPLLEAALSHHGYVPRRVEAVLGPDDHGHASEAAEELRNGPAREPDPGHPTGYFASQADYVAALEAHTDSAIECVPNGDGGYVLRERGK